MNWDKLGFNIYYKFYYYSLISQDIGRCQIRTIVYWISKMTKVIWVKSKMNYMQIWSAWGCLQHKVSIAKSIWFSMIVFKQLCTLYPAKKNLKFWRNKNKKTNLANKLNHILCLYLRILFLIYLWIKLKCFAKIS
jgi:hypothetical protein